MKRTILTVVFAIVLIATSFGQTVIIKNIEVTVGKTFATPGVLVIDEEGKSNFTEYESGKYDKMNTQRTKVFYSIINEYLTNEYKIISTASQGAGYSGSLGMNFTTYIMIKE